MDTRVMERTFALLTDAAEIEQAQKSLWESFAAKAAWTEPRTIGSRGGRLETKMAYVEAADVWLATSDKLLVSHGRWYNGFGHGSVPEDQPTTPVVEINVPRDGVNPLVAGAFLRDEDDHLYLAHSGKVRSSRKGVGKAAFLRDSANPVVRIGKRDHVLVGRVDEDDFVAEVAAYVRWVRDFKASATSGEDDGLHQPDAYWLFQANPEQFNLADDLTRRKPGDDETWTVTRYVERMAPGQRVLLWQGGTEAGIYAVGTLTGKPEEQDGANPYRSGEGKRKWHQVSFRYDTILSRPLLKAEIKDDDLLGQLTVIKAPNSTNFEVEEDQWERIVELLEERGESVAQALSPEGREIAERVIQWYPDANLRGKLVELMADAIEAAHRVSEKSWCATAVAPGQVRLNVGRNAILTLSPGDVVHLAFSGSDTPPAVLEEIESLGTDAYEYKGSPSGVYRTWKVADFARLASHVSHEVVRFATESARACLNSPYLRSHSQAVVEAVAHLAGRDLPQANFADLEVSSYWKISPGRGASLWPTWRDGNHVSIGWGELGNLSGLSRDEFDARLNSLVDQQGWTRAGAEQAWRFSQIPVGARIVANDGTKRVLGIGTVVGGYEFSDREDVAVDADGASHSHRLPVRWDDLNERSVERGGWRKTLIKLSAADFEEIVAPRSTVVVTEGDEPGAAETEDALDFDGIIANLVDKGFYFSEETVATYLLALQAKRFVILSGISGTGKTALALEVARGLQGSAAPEVAPTVSQRASVVTVKPYNLQYRRIMLPAELTKAHPGFVEAAEEHKRVLLKYPGGAQEVTVSKPKQARTVFVLLAGEASTWFTSTFEEGDTLALAIEPDETGAPGVVRIAGQSETEAAATAPPRYELVAVRPDWTDNHGLLGFYNPLTGEYTATAFLSLLLRAREEQERAQREQRPARPHFVILDEMNLARVEHYFSDFLSCLESGEAIVLHHDLALEEQGGVPRTVRVPTNLFFTGTVNVDESTYMFSPKVLDRAFTLEFNEVDLDSYGAEAEAQESEGSPLRLSHFEGRLRVQEKPSPKDWATFREQSPDLAAVLANLNRVLRRTHRHFGYRVANEIARFLNLAAVQAGTEAAARWAALDVAVLSKALPKLHGTQQELEATLVELFKFAIDPAASDVKLDDWRLEAGVLKPSRAPDGEGETPPTARLPRTAGKLLRMIERLRAHGFTAFIE
jgi:predicted RNA-binding protein with PUA-like domain